MEENKNKYGCLPFWSWNDELDPKELEKQIEWMSKNGVGGFFMHARGGLTTPYLGEKWFECVEASIKKADEVGLEPYAYDENGWPSGFAGGKLLEDKENHDRYLAIKRGPFDPEAYCSYDDSTDKLVPVSEGASCVNLYWHYSSATADILNPEVVDKFIALTHEEYLKRDPGHHLKGFFTDEPQYYRWGTPFTKVLPPYWEKKYHEDIRTKLGLLFLEKEGYKEFRYRYWLSMQDLMLHNWAMKLYGWCESHGYSLTGHYVEETTLGNQLMCCGGVMPFYEYETIPGIDWLGRPTWNELSPKQVGTVSAQLGKKQTIAEMFACAGWDVTPRELKHIADYLYVGGVNITCQHLMPYSEHGQRKRDYPSHFSPVNPWVEKRFKEFNEYYSTLGKLLSESTEVVDVGVLNPIRSAYFYYKRDLDNNGFGVGSIENPFFDLINKLQGAQIPHHYLDETIMEKHAYVKGNKLVVGKCSYSYIILPHMETMGSFTAKLLEEYAKNGGKILLVDGAPSYLEGKPHEYPFLKSNITFEEIMALLPYRTKGDEGVFSTLRKDGEGRMFFFLTNQGKEKTTISFDLNGYSSFEKMDLFTGKKEVVPTAITLDKDESAILYFSKEKAKEPLALAPLQLGKKFEVIGSPSNFLTLDFISYSTDGKNFSEPLPTEGIFNILLEKRYKGDLFLKYAFNVKKSPQKCTVLIENTHLLDLRINGQKAKFIGSSKLEKELYEYDIASSIVNGSNSLVAKINFYESDNVYFVLFGGATEGLKNCLAYDTTIEAAYLKGDFGVYGSFHQGKTEEIMLGEDFYIAEPKKVISSLIEDGYPFFRGEICLKETVNVENTNLALYVPRRFQLLGVSVNGKYVDTMMFSSTLDLSKYLKKGSNDLVLDLTVSNRNLLGPSHTLKEEDLSVGPDTFELTGTWKDGKSPEFLDRYSFIKTII